MLTENKNNVKRILLTGGGTGGSVSPLLAIVENLKETEFPIGNSVSCDFLWIGTKGGPEKNMVRQVDIKFKSIFSGKFRRYFSLRNFIDPFLILIGFLEALAVQLVWRPDLVMSAGSFVSVPVIWAAWILRIPILIHQQDIRPGLANKLMAPFARVVTVTFEESLKHYGKKAIWTGNPARQSLAKSKVKSQKSKVEGLPVVLIMGGGTGAAAINELVWEGLDRLTKFCQIIHITGKNKNPNYQLPTTNYNFFDFLNAEQMAGAYDVADIVVSRCGLGTLTELSNLGKPSILIPIPDSHQEENAKIFKEAQAAIVLNQKDLTSEKLADNMEKLLSDKELCNKLHNNIQGVIKKGANKKITEIIDKLVQ